VKKGQGMALVFEVLGSHEKQFAFSAFAVSACDRLNGRGKEKELV